MKIGGAGRPGWVGGAKAPSTPRSVKSSGTKHHWASSARWPKIIMLKAFQRNMSKVKSGVRRIVRIVRRDRIRVSVRVQG